MNVRNVLPPPQNQSMISNAKSFVNIIWNNFFLSIYQLFNADSYSYKNISVSASGISGSYSTSAVYLTDRENVLFNLTISPNTSIDFTGAHLSGFPDLPIAIYPAAILVVDSNNILVDSRTSVVGLNGVIKIPDVSGVTDNMIITGSFLRAF